MNMRAQEALQLPRAGPSGSPLKPITLPDALVWRPESQRAPRSVVARRSP